ncbi:MAG TPA: glucose-1-phosphate adenylyltransferase subunit GlgD [Thermotogota bacterium]|nr:glucose-1-phosphate adenylyltransferase subunit GlgD [Thermotogota bacterium]HPJ88553.1 glucose-1-phosphate adenylyltransferase subunit GlgD [Thermotogota bacterium]HPR96704.1 glucose-1-phosphate adenylyltransferase subunit GlgD [Thermotogota bacterium]
MKVLGLIFAGGRGENLGLLTTKRASAALPVAGKYRMIDFTLSNMVASNIRRVGVLTQYSPRSLIDHLGSGKEWDLDRKHGGLTLLQPYMAINNKYWYRGTGDAIHQNMTFLRRSDEDYVLMASGDHIYTMNYSELFNYHFSKGADVTFLYKEMDESYDLTQYGQLELTEDGRITNFYEKPEEIRSNKAFLGVYFINKHLLMDLLYNTIPQSAGYDILLDVLIPNLHKLRFYGYKFDGYWRNTKKGINEYFRINQDLLDENVRNQLFYTRNTVHTKLKDLPSPKCTGTAHVKNSIVSDGCIISGRVINSVISRGVQIKAGAVVENSIIMQDTIVEEGAHVKYSVFDKECNIRTEKRLIGRKDDLLVFEKGSVV